MDAASRMLCDYASSVQSSDDDSDTSQRKPRKVVQRTITAESSKSKLSSNSDAFNERVSHSPNKEVNGRQNSSSSEDHPPLSEVRHHDVDPSRSRHRRHRDRYLRRKRHSRSRSNSHSRRHSKRGHSRRHRHSRHECCDRHRHSASKSRHRHHRHRRHSTPSSTSSSSASSRSRCRVHVKESKRLIDVPTQVVLDTNSTKGTESTSQKSDPVQTATSSTLSTVTIQASSSLPTTTTASAVTTSLAPRINAQEILNQIQKHQEAQAKAQAIAAAATANLPKYYNPTSVNPLKLAEQQEKRKLLWSKKKDESGDPKDSKTSLWTTTSIIAGKGDTAAAAKFRKLMGIHDDTDLKARDDRDVDIDTDAQKRAEEQAELFRRLELEYEQSRALTHTQRGVGLGFSSAAHVDYSAYSAMQQDTRDKTN
ncbi:hypothetical protein EG68_11880 [Paragonimus skrjabini miyazakii]|uniref:Small acidic protein-like domain-containing protein n=1 Tax=Paragonimus skrjabini miyazakii TaxID=59628 RepID=A0A8S9YHM7_9TREM|nr:hypothetical protein EG68_11880 [Paragonimus skrjabini miyazakii]